MSVANRASGHGLYKCNDFADDQLALSLLSLCLLSGSHFLFSS